MVEETAGHPSGAAAIILFFYLIVFTAIEIILSVLIFCICCWIFVATHSEKRKHWRKTTARPLYVSDDNVKTQFAFIADDKIVRCNMLSLKKYGTEIIYNVKIPGIYIQANRKFWFRKVVFLFVLLIIMIVFFMFTLSLPLL